MLLENFQHSSAGKCIHTPQDYWAFIPNPLPPSIDTNWELISQLSEADRHLSELCGVGQQLPNPHLLINPCIRREAVESSRIEGTQASLSDLFYFEADPSTTSSISDVKEVHNYVKAMDYGLNRLNDLPISGRLIKEIHQILMEGVRGEYATPGDFRRSQNWIGPPGCSLKEATYVPPPPSEMESCFSDWEKYIHGDHKQPILIQCALLHYQFEAIHPFIDGNGRVGRLFITFFLCEKKYMSIPLLYLSAYFEKNREEYYRRLLGVSQKGEWNEWIHFFLRGVSIQAKASIQNANKILSLHADYKKRIGNKRITSATLQLIDYLFMHPVISIPKLSEEWKIPFAAVKRGVDKLISAQILKEVTGQQRNRLYAATELLKLLSTAP